MTLNQEMEMIRGFDWGDVLCGIVDRANAEPERWLPCPGYEGRYEVSDLGRIRSLRRVETTKGGARRFVAGGLLSPMRHQQGYLQVSLRKDGKMRTVRLHRLIGEAFHGHLKNALHRELAHLDGNPSNARADNLKWVSRRENMHHRVLHGTDDRGERHASAKLTNAQAAEIRRTSGDRRAIAEKFGISRALVGDIRCGRRYAHVTDHRLSQGEK